MARDLQDRQQQRPDGAGKGVMLEERLEIGPGAHPLAGFDALDVVARPGVTYVASWGMEPLPIPDQRYDFVFTSHCLEHVPWQYTNRALNEVYRILKPGGHLEVWVPDFACIVKAYTRKQCGDGWRRFNPDGDFMRWVNGRLFAYMGGETKMGPENFHRACFDAPYLIDCLAKAGFVRVQQLKQRRRGISHGVVDLGVVGWKP